MRYKKSYGQHILASDTIAEAMVNEKGVSIQSNDTVLEIGPGTGMLTKHILALNPKKVIAVEKDPEMVAHLKAHFKNPIASGQLVVRETDALTYDPTDDGLQEGAYLLVANIPYYITGALLKRYLAEVAQPKRMLVMIQREVAERITKDEAGSILSMSVRAYGTPRILRIVKPGSFVPPPEVDSALLLIEDLSKEHFTQMNVSEEDFFTILKEGFKEKRKQLKNNLESLAPAKEIAAAYTHCELEETVRAEKLSINHWMCLTQHLKK